MWSRRNVIAILMRQGFLFVVLSACCSPAYAKASTKYGMRQHSSSGYHSPGHTYSVQHSNPQGPQNMARWSAKPVRRASQGHQTQNKVVNTGASSLTLPHTVIGSSHGRLASTNLPNDHEVPSPSQTGSGDHAVRQAPARSPVVYRHSPNHLPMNRTHVPHQ